VTESEAVRVIVDRKKRQQALASATMAICAAGVHLKGAGLETSDPTLEALRQAIRRIEQLRKEV
jgi:hypothetical protein